jgi:hypothetical protein
MRGVAPQSLRNSTEPWRPHRPRQPGRVAKDGRRRARPPPAREIMLLESGGLRLAGPAGLSRDAPRTDFLARFLARVRVLRRIISNSAGPQDGRLSDGSPLNCWKSISRLGNPIEGWCVLARLASNPSASLWLLVTPRKLGVAPARAPSSTQCLSACGRLYVGGLDLIAALRKLRYD